MVQMGDSRFRDYYSVEALDVRGKSLKIAALGNPKS